jgi:hypothetical protein
VIATDRVRCHGCGAEKDPAALEVYPYPDDDRFGAEPVRPLFTLDAQPRPPEAGEWKAVNVCHHCLHRLDPDMWISSTCWKSIDPVTPWADLPAFVPRLRKKGASP